jgi:hypothetical protein
LYRTMSFATSPKERLFAEKKTSEYTLFESGTYNVSDEFDFVNPPSLSI